MWESESFGGVHVALGEPGDFLRDKSGSGAWGKPSASSQPRPFFSHHRPGPALGLLLHLLPFHKPQVTLTRLEPTCPQGKNLQPEQRGVSGMQEEARGAAVYLKHTHRAPEVTCLASLFFFSNVREGR